MGSSEVHAEAGGAGRAETAQSRNREWGELNMLNTVWKS
jgi:hypothetical protein